MSAPFDKWPAELPEKPSGWTKHMSMHLNFGGAGGMGVYKIKDSAGNEMPIGYQYDTRKGGQTGFTLPDVEPTMSWKELIGVWPGWYATQREKLERDRQPKEGGR